MIILAPLYEIWPLLWPLPSKILESPLHQVSPICSSAMDPECWNCSFLFAILFLFFSGKKRALIVFPRLSVSKVKISYVQTRSWIKKRLNTEEPKANHVVAMAPALWILWCPSSAHHMPSVVELTHQPAAQFPDSCLCLVISVHPGLRDSWVDDLSVE